MGRNVHFAMLAIYEDTEDEYMRFCRERNVAKAGGVALLLELAKAHGELSPRPEHPLEEVTNDDTDTAHQG